MKAIKDALVTCPYCNKEFIAVFGAIDAECPHCRRAYPIEHSAEVIEAVAAYNQAVMRLKRLGYTANDGCLKEIEELPSGIGVITIGRG